MAPLLKGEIFAAECLTEPRGGSDFFGTTTTAEDKGDYFLINGQKRFIVGAARPALEIATGYSMKRKAFGTVINQFQGVSFQIAEASMLLDAARSMVYTTCRAVDTNQGSNLIRRMVSETKKFVTESCQKIAHNSMQVMGGIGYTNIYPVERIVRDLMLASIWTGTNEVMSFIIANEWYREYMISRKAGTLRDCEKDAPESDAVDEKIYE